ncbi:hypothetical protein SAMN04488087_1697 [Rhodothermus profundi]|uniref:6-bladed beta-propeller n=2 Tax=Rhodothermus profundi TaxID=633813 RepID=A0A1M6UGE3_9BACT|nr:hypothetical protein SAMN04488087_1697 [Rhodothermus profundi]
MIYDFELIEIEQEEEKSLISGVFDYVIDSIYVYITDTKWVKVFDRSGKFIRILGDRGTGPGEYQDPLQIFKCKELIGVYDAVLKKVLLFKNFEFVLDFPLVVSGNLFEEPFCRGPFLYAAVRGYTPDFPYHLFKVDTSGKIVKVAFRMEEKYRGYFRTGLFFARLLDLGDKIYFTHALYKKAFYFSYDLDSLYAEEMQMPRTCQLWQWKKHKGIAQDAESYAQLLKSLSIYTHLEAPCILVDVNRYNGNMIFVYRYGNGERKIILGVYHKKKSIGNVFIVPLIDILMRKYIGNGYFVDIYMSL